MNDIVTMTIRLSRADKDRLMKYARENDFSASQIIRHLIRNHTYLTIAASSGLDIKTLQAIAGHADIQMTMNCYVHKREEKIIEANDLISGSFTAL